MLKTLSVGTVVVLLFASSVQAQESGAMARNKVIGIDHVVINVIDIDKALEFYKKLGLKINNEDGWRNGKGQVSVQIGENQKLNIHKEQAMGPDSKFQITGGPEDRLGLAKAPVAGGADFCVVWNGTVEEAQQHIRAAGVDHIIQRVQTGARGTGSSVYFRDPDGNLWEFITYGK